MSPVAIDLLVRALALLGLAWMAVTLLRRQSASLRASVWTAALAGVLVLPVMASVAPRLDVPVWRAEAPMMVATSQFAGSDQPTPRPRRSAEPSAKAEDPAAEEKVSVLTTASTASPSVISWGQMAFVTWLVGALILVARITLSHVGLSRMARSGSALVEVHEEKWARLVKDARTQLGIRRAVRVRTTDAIGVPVVAGLFAPVLLLPAESDDWSPEVSRAVVLHELAHVARWDSVGQLVSQLACATYWCVPLAWHAARRAAVLREQASDDVVLMSGVKASAYAENLLTVASLAGNSALEPAALAMAHPRRIRERIVAILDPSCVREGQKTRSIGTVTVAVTLVAALVAVIQPTTRAAASLPVTIIHDGDGAETGIAPIAPAQTAVAAPATSVMVRVGTPAAEADLPQARAVRPCERELQRSSSSNNDDGTNKRWTVTMSGPDCKVDLRVDGTAEFNETFTDVKGLSRGGTFRLDVTEGGVRHELELLERGGSLTRVYRVDGRERAFDNDGRAWLADFLITLDRRTAIGVDIRLPLLLKQGGVDAVLAETGLMGSDYPRSRYYEKLMDARQLTTGERARLLKQAASVLKSDHYSSTVLAKAGGAGFEDNEVRAAALAMIDGMESDHYRSTSVATVMGAGRPTAGDMDVLVRTVERIKSDHYKLEVLKRIVTGPLQAQHRAALSRAARTVQSDHYATEFLKALSGGGADGPERQVFFDVIDTIESDHYVLEVLKSLTARQAPSRAEFQQAVRVLPRIESDHYRNEAVQSLLLARDLTEVDLLGLLGSVSSMRGDHYKSESLQAVARHRAATDKVRAGVIDASDRMGSHYREQVRRAAGRN